MRSPRLAPVAVAEAGRQAGRPITRESIDPAVEQVPMTGPGAETVKSLESHTHSTRPGVST